MPTEKKSAPKKKKELTMLQKLEKGARARKLDAFSADSSKWYRNKVRAMGGQTARDTLLQQQKQRGFGLSRAPGPGFMYTFVYDAKHKDTLPYWDAFPLILLVDVTEDGFYGLNLHYFPPKMRAAFFDKLLEYKNNRANTNKQKLALSYGLLKSAARLSIFKFAFKRYLSSHVASTIVKIPSSEWEAALYLPTSNFQKAVNSKVWMDASKA